MDLSHSFTVPTSLDATWAHFQDIGALAECFPGAQVTAVGTDDDGAPTFEGTCKVKLGPIALVYAGSGKFVERDEAGHRFVVDAKGRDKRGNGTAGATVAVTM
ncbi:SRPBCC domain-containing protein, partial [Nocardioides kongjuensis]|uniref:SRPBCC domain-containing protein n=1 Tax=Nocardioides kongjuensis TaxID=349522 RepID=UPI0035E92871